MEFDFDGTKVDKNAKEDIKDKKNKKH